MYPSIGTSLMSTPSLRWVPAGPVPHVHRYYGFLRLLRAHPVGLWSPLTEQYLGLHTEETRRSPRFLGNPFESVPRARDSGGSPGPRLSVLAIQPSAQSNASA